jgi:hypothetical protein
MAGLLLLGAFVLNQVMIVHLPAYSQGSLHQDATDVMIKFKDDVDASVSECSDVFAHLSWQDSWVGLGKLVSQYPRTLLHGVHASHWFVLDDV